MNFLPSKNWTLALFAFAAICLIGFVFYRTQYAPKETFRLALIGSDTQGVSIGQDTLKDTDADGLPDWEETLWSTNPQAGDTDGDGTDDGAEVREGRDPLVKGPNDKLDVTEGAVQGEGAGVSPTITDKLARDVFAKYLSLRQQGTPVDSETSTSLATAALQRVSVPQPKTYAASNLIIQNDESTAAIHAYANALGDIVNRYGKPNVDHEIVIVAEALSNNDGKRLDDLSIIVESYTKVIGALLKMPVPKGAAQAHLSLINNAEAIATAIDEMRLLFSDPVAALAGLELYKTASSELGVSLETLYAYAKSRGVTFLEGESGTDFFANQIY
ncbi:hypothetical protein A3D66_02590 [Candidatus Kaiserbacteria bacterium RIFCSPHIGHO2_02_FULL_50_9]|uniref:Uncharacterized protein n=1 Tax=Candidatus Kaiserbacteria bacterium RIFCSPLOWO2_01_FULL_51_21 TaxID=1798508 RepID=A0A1F6EDC4_9BACT|nr:MAG: hypothetical protein A2761_02605 [Candidatus Kaiserbacteria bacterium RIFCSPHIGHO2_01_FULL_51_33]OGG63562.1 MAG: hypothetical protein A3D66_02590 [Candidatus Kaiserbacteria bacterium RIFCSPHIGHO2_02_FULL_50_9]OGG71669.1 MAG: hypothetical protein A3A35_00695 [Candidatus Kaiserbacteria bacterium RIFCSPLOWO2_01_FULL_51_21]